MFHYSYFMSWDIYILDSLLWIAKVFLLLHCSNQIRKMLNKSKVSGPELNHDYISYSDIKRFHIDEIVEADLWFPWTTQEFVVRLNLLVPGCSIGIHRYSFPPPRKVHSESQEQSLFFLSFRYGNAMQEVGNLVVSDDEKSFYLMWHFWKPEIWKSVMLEDDCRYLMVRYLRSVLKAQTERINRLLEGYLSHFSANQKDWSCWMLLSAAIT